MTTDYQKEQAAKAEIVNNLVVAIAAALAKLIGGTAIAALNENQRDRINLEGGRSIHVGKEWNRPRLNISGNWPKNDKGEVFSPRSFDKTPEGQPAYSSISVSMERSPEAIASDIARRFLPGYLAEYTRQLERVESSNNYADDTRDSIRLAGKALGLPVPGAQGRDKNSLSLYNHGFGEVGGNVEASGEHLKLELSSLTREQAAAILAVVKSFKG